MERESFEDEAIAAEMNRLYINIKVDRERRPDLDSLYMTAVQVMTRHGGWPMSVFLMPDLRPIYAGTYFPPADAYGRPGFVTILRAIEDAYRHRRAEVEQSATEVVQILSQLAQPAAPADALRIDDELIAALVDQSTTDYDRAHGGFGGAPKFPRQTLLEMLLVYNRHFPSPGRMRQVLHALDAMAAGGIRDHLSGAFHRYSTDAQWLVPHFEIMLYDNAMLAWVYTEAYRQTAQRKYADVANGILDFMLRELRAPSGAFYTALDAEVDAMEGASYLWTAAEIDQLLGPDAALFKQAYGVDRGPNFADPHHGAGVAEKNVLYLPRPLEEVAMSVSIPVEELESRLAKSRQILYDARRNRKQPRLDSKILASWNALAIRALAFAGRVLENDRYLSAATIAGKFIADRLNTEIIPNVFLDDYAFMVEAALALYESTADVKWKEIAQELAGAMQVKFGDDRFGGFFFTEASATDLLVRQKIGMDSPLPAGNAVAARALLALAKPDESRKVIALFAGAMARMGESMSAMIEAASLYLRQQPPFTVQAADRAGVRPLEIDDSTEEIVVIAARWIDAMTLHVHIEIAPPFHVNAADVGSDLIALRIDIPGGAGDKLEQILYPPGAAGLYSGQITIPVRFGEAPAADEPIDLAITYQACDDTSCRQAVTRRLRVPLPKK